MTRLLNGMFVYCPGDESFVFPENVDVEKDRITYVFSLDSFSQSIELCANCSDDDDLATEVTEERVYTHLYNLPHIMEKWW